MNTMFVSRTEHLDFSSPGATFAWLATRWMPVTHDFIIFSKMVISVSLTVMVLSIS